MALDDFAIRKRCTYGTLVIDLKKRCPIDLFPGRTQEDVKKWLQQYPHIQLVSRDGSKTYASGISGASQDITQVSDRWHILKQLFEAVKQTLNHRLPTKWRPKKAHPNGSSRSFTRKLDKDRWEGEEKRWLEIQYAQKLYKEGVPIARIATRVGRSRGTIYKYLNMKDRPNHKRASPFDRFRPMIHSYLKKGKTGNDIEKECRRQGFSGSRSTLNRLIAEERENSSLGPPVAIRSKVLSVLWKSSKDHRSTDKLDSQWLESFPFLIPLYQLVFEFRQLMKEKQSSLLGAWIDKYKNSEFPAIQSFIKGLKSDYRAIVCGIDMKWNNGMAEGHVNRLKMQKRLMYGRAAFDLLRTRVLYNL